MSHANAKSGNKITGALIWKFGERIGVSGAQFILQILLARLLSPDHYGVLSLMIIFTSLANVFIQRGFNTALIQNKDVTEEDYSSVFWVTLAIAGIIYAGLFVGAPLIADFYDMPDIIAPFRVLALVLFPGALNSIQIAKLSRELDFKKIFYGNVAGIVIAGTTGVIVAYLGGGLWALVAQNILNVLVPCVVMRTMVNWKIRFVCNGARIKVLFSYGWKLLVSSLIDTLYQDIRSLVVGKKYSSDALGFYDRGKQFPQFLINAINTTVQNVMLPAMSARQDEPEKVKSMMRTSIRLSGFIVFPMMAGLAAVSTPLVIILLTEKWLPSVPYMMIYCFVMAFHPVHSCNLQAINAMGRSDIFLKLEVIKKAMGLMFLAIAAIFFDSPIAIAFTGIISTLINCFVNSYPNQKLIGYSYINQMKDILPSVSASLVMFVVVYFVGTLDMNVFLLLGLQILVGVAVYVALAVVFKMEAFYSILNIVKGLISKKTKKEA